MSNPLGDLISKGEGNYNSFNRGNAGDSRGQTIDFSQMTLGEIQAAQHLGRHDPHRLFAVGKYQIIPDTMDDATKRLKLDPDQKFTPELQERIFADYLIAGKRPQIEAYIKGEPGATLHAAQKAACQEWASVEDPDTPGKPYAPYLKHGNNHSSITSGQIAGALNTMRNEYQADIAKGMTPNEAWGAVTHSTASHERMASTHAPHPHTTQGSHTLEQGSHGQSTHDLQATLAGLGYLDPKGVDGQFGIGTRHAVERFQHDHHLTVDGKAGPLTQQAMHSALSQQKTAHDLTDSRHPDHALYEQALNRVHALDAKQGRSTTQESLNLAAALVVEAKHEHMTRIDQVTLGDNGSRVYIAQNPTSPMEIAKYGSVDTLTAVHTTMAQSSAAALADPSPRIQPAVVPPPQPDPSPTLNV
ncbi:peptidoglycan-binding protein [Rhodanobacter sp. DHG33]|uniref:peptidoglycan-binding protein n=1 Tax=Rhodanobacter sp. DHG33 TaxID=2775921 RepID=UPI00177ECC2C|nr:peptidoglycan-binding protein [Rhodanobacter sp. DHG33]MBD8899994.1 peptidoglycan-binding protein [Rhodanobacter sp. DHG33]